MTRFLSHTLQASEPFFSHDIQKLEKANGNPGHDIRLSSEIMYKNKLKISRLGLDPKDTTPEELYYALRHRMIDDDRLLTRSLQTRAAVHVSAEADVVAGMIHAISELPESKRCYGIKSSTLKSLIRKNPPKKAMKNLGYRSVDSFLKHEKPALILASALLSEDGAWVDKLMKQYRGLKPRDFENRKITLLQPTSKKWQSFARDMTLKRKNNLIIFKTLGAIVFLPLDKNTPNGTTTASIGLALRGLNEIRATSAFLKLCQVRLDFGELVENVSKNEAVLRLDTLNRPVKWSLLQQYLSQFNDKSIGLFEPYLEADDIAWHSVGQSLSEIEPRFAFWQGNSYLGALKGGKTVSLNPIDTAVNLCNKRSYEEQSSQFLKKSLWQELQMRYLRPSIVEESIMGHLQPKLSRELIGV